MPPVPPCPSVDACIWLADSDKDAWHCIPFPASSPNLHHGLADKCRSAFCPILMPVHAISSDKAFHSGRNLSPHRHESSGNLSLLRGGLSLFHPYAISPLLYINRDSSLHPTNEPFKHYVHHHLFILTTSALATRQSNFSLSYSRNSTSQPVTVVSLAESSASIFKWAFFSDTSD